MKVFRKEKLEPKPWALTVQKVLVIIYTLGFLVYAGVYLFNISGVLDANQTNMETFESDANKVTVSDYLVLTDGSIVGQLSNGTPFTIKTSQMVAIPKTDEDGNAYFSGGNLITQATSSFAGNIIKGYKLTLLTGLNFIFLIFAFVYRINNVTIFSKGKLAIGLLIFQFVSDLCLIGLTYLLV